MYVISSIDQGVKDLLYERGIEICQPPRLSDGLSWLGCNWGRGLFHQ
jgi:hypothetical protein